MATAITKRKGRPSSVRSAGSKVTASLFRASLTMFLSVVRLRLVYSPLYKMLKPLRPVEGWIYKKLRAPQPLSRSVKRNED